MRKLLLPAVAVLLLAACQSKTNSENSSDTTQTAMPDSATLTYQLPDPKNFEGDVNGKKTALYLLKNDKLQVAITNFGARIVSLIVPDKAGKPTDVSAGFASLADYQKAGEPFYGPIVGRVGNRIANGKFTLDGKTYQTELNNNGHTLHGGPTGFHNQVWDARQVDDKTLELTYTAKDGEGGFPGNLTTKVVYSLTDSGLKIDYTATTDKPTPNNPTSHGFFNLNGEGSGTINDHSLMIDADRYSAVDKGLIPQGEPVSVEGTPFDFRQPTAIGARVGQENEQLKFGGGYDHNWVLNKKPGELTKAGQVTGDKSGITMEIYTTEPAMQFYGGNFFTGKDAGKYGKATNFREALALETQHYPDSPNHPTYPNTILKPGETFRSTTEYRFSVK